MLQSIYWLTTVGHVMEGELYGDEISVALHMSLEDAVKHAKKYHCKQIFSQEMAKDAIPRLYNGGGGFVEKETLVWTNQSL